MRKWHTLPGAIGILLWCTTVVNAQSNFSTDTTYYTAYPKHVAARIFLSQKYGTLFFRAEDQKDLRYIANTKLHLGAGVTLGNITLNGSVGVGYIRNDAKVKGKTTSYDLQVHLFPHNWVMDGMAIYNKGYHLGGTDVNQFGGHSYYYRPDVKLTYFSAAAYRIASADKFSFRAAIGQSEWQRKSAGSLLYGGNASYGRMKGDSALIPQVLSSNFQQAGVTSIRFFHVGPGIGYAYTAVAAEHLFIMASLIGNLDLNITSEDKAGDTKTKAAVMPGAIYKTAIGYNSATWSLAADLTGNALLIKGKLKEGGYILPIGIYRLVLTRKFIH